MSQAQGGYYLPGPSHWPIVGSIGLAFLLGGFAHFLHGDRAGGDVDALDPGRCAGRRRLHLRRRVVHRGDATAGSPAELPAPDRAIPSDAEL